MLLAIATISLMAGLFGLILGYAAIRFKVEGNPIVEQIDALLPQTQCGQCTFPGCRPYAEAIANGEAPINQCPPGGQATIVAARRSARYRGPGTERRDTASISMYRCWQSSTSKPASAVRCASRLARWTRSSVLPSTCTPSSPTNAPDANCACRPVRWIASTWCRRHKLSKTGSGRLRDRWGRPAMRELHRFHGGIKLDGHKAESARPTSLQQASSAAATLTCH